MAYTHTHSNTTVKKRKGKKKYMETFLTAFDYKSKKWKKKRALILRRDKYLCQECRKYGRRREAVTVHHIKHTETHPELAYTDNNLISLCNACHNKMHPEKGGKHWK